MSEIAHAATDRRMSRFFWIGLVLLCVGTGPLLIVILAAQLGLTRDPNPNPVGFGILALFTFWPSVLLIVVGIVSAFSRSSHFGRVCFSLLLALCARYVSDVLVRRDDFAAPPTSNQSLEPTAGPLRGKDEG